MEHGIHNASFTEWVNSGKQDLKYHRAEITGSECGKMTVQAG